MATGYGQSCPVARALDVIGERWTLLVVRDLFLGYRRFREFQRQSPGIPARVLSDRLKKLETSGIVERVVYSEHPLRAEYRLTAKGESLRPVVQALFDWGMEHRLSEREQASVMHKLHGDERAVDTSLESAGLPRIAT